MNKRANFLLLAGLLVAAGGLFAAFKQALPRTLSTQARWVFERAGPCLNNDHVTRLAAHGQCLALQTYYAKQAVHPQPILLIFIHGDGIPGGGPADYLKVQATQFSHTDVVPIVLIRPGYYDSYGHYSTGNGYGFACDGYPCDGYRPQVVATLAAAIANLKQFYQPRAVILVGHSGGAMMSGIILGKYPQLVDAAVLASVTYNVKAWAASHQGWGSWNQSLSPSDFVAKIPKKDLVYILSGEQDRNTWPKMARQYYSALKKHGVDAHFVSVPKANHNSVVLAKAQAFHQAIQQVLAHFQ